MAKPAGAGVIANLLQPTYVVEAATATWGESRFDVAHVMPLDVPDGRMTAHQCCDEESEIDSILCLGECSEHGLFLPAAVNGPIALMLCAPEVLQLSSHISIYERFYRPPTA